MLVGSLAITYHALCAYQRRGNEHEENSVKRPRTQLRALVATANRGIWYPAQDGGWYTYIDGWCVVMDCGKIVTVYLGKYRPGSRRTRKKVRRGKYRVRI